MSVLIRHQIIRILSCVGWSEPYVTPRLMKEGREASPGQEGGDSAFTIKSDVPRGVDGQRSSAPAVAAPRKQRAGGQGQGSVLHATFTAPSPPSEDRGKQRRDARDRLGAKCKWRPCRSLWGGTHCAAEGHSQFLLAEAAPSSRPVPSLPLA